jgi:hypothetical protein
MTEQAGTNKDSGIKKYLNSESGLVQYALSEFRAVGWMNENNEFPCDEGEDFKAQETICCDALELLEVFSKEEHSGSLALYLISMLEKLLRFEPIGALTGADDEWVKHSSSHFQNKRCSHVFKDDDRFDGQAYDAEAVIFREKNGSCFISSESCRPITFPYTPHSKYVDVDDDDATEGIEGGGE